ncbi:hypothetical protein NUU61_006412 [Penicillium alfredii]|uniref:AB hydrolase-1 domain-containing protein n=1 Tax=Penicillium alfredii TaxID=1506179 RepID=A0A9W9F0V7_9EURO|nr:uncharacterized protein NUU61_006412 [Penicillium alfredii]KAJ5091542.1 hypothetical protein NUU61_006412 [Penicillium alfredii]
MNATPGQPDWTIDQGSLMVPIGTHRLYMSVSGIRRMPEDPLIVILTGAGDVASSYTAVKPLVSQFAREVLYDRSGLGRSEPSPATSPSTAVSAARDLHSLLEATNQRPPLILVAHSYGGIIAREYLHLYPDDVAGMVLVESSTERQCDYFRVPDPNINALLGDLKFAQVTGLRADSKLSREEWRLRAMDIARGAVAAQAEADSFVEVCRALGEKLQYQRRVMGNKPLGVIRGNSARDYERIYHAGVEVGNGTEEQRKAFRELLDRWESIDRVLMEEQLQLSSNTHLVHVPDCGHHVHLVRPEIVAAEIKWVLGRAPGAPRDDQKL